MDDLQEIRDKYERYNPPFCIVEFTATDIRTLLDRIGLLEQEAVDEAEENEGICSCRFDYAVNEPVTECLYHKTIREHRDTLLEEVDRLKKENSEPFDTELPVCPLCMMPDRRELQAENERLKKENESLEYRLNAMIRHVD